MATSETEIVNSALGHIGIPAIASIDDNGTAARAAKRQYPLKRDALIRRYRWNFAVTRVSLAPDGTKPAFGFENQFTVPADQLAIIGLFDEDELQRNYTSSTQPWKKEGDRILADGDLLKLFYIRRVTDPRQFDALFDDALGWFLAIDLGPKLSASKKMVELAAVGFKDAIKVAKLADAIEGTPEVIEMSTWLDSRLSSGPLRAGPIVF